MKLGVVGLGLIGGSMALDLKACGFANKILGFDSSEANQQEAISLGLVDHTCTLQELCLHSDIIILAIPVNAITLLLPEIMNSIHAKAIITDVGSTKGQIALSLANHAKRNQFVLAHPMAGTEFSGPKAAIRGLFKHKAVVICDHDKSEPSHLEKIKKMYEALEMRVIFMDSRSHDLHAAYVSHLSHISSFVLANTVLDKEKDLDAIFNLASAGFESTVRLAKSSPEMWTPIFEQNQVHVIEALGEYIDRLRDFHTSLVSRNYAQTKKYMENANKIRRVLAQITGQQKIDGSKP